MPSVQRKMALEQRESGGFTTFAAMSSPRDGTSSGVLLRALRLCYVSRNKAVTPRGGASRRDAAPRRF